MMKPQLYNLPAHRHIVHTCKYIELDCNVDLNNEIYGPCLEGSSLYIRAFLSFLWVNPSHYRLRFEKGRKRFELPKVLFWTPYLADNFMLLKEDGCLNPR